MSEEIKVRQPKVRKPKMTEEEQKAQEKAEKKEEKLVDIEEMLNAFGIVSARVSYSNKRTTSCAASIRSHLKGMDKDVGNNPDKVLLEWNSKLALDINGTTTAQKLAYEAFQELDKVIKKMRMNPWKKIIVKLRGEMFDRLHNDMVLIDQLSVDFGKVAEMQAV